MKLYAAALLAALALPMAAQKPVKALFLVGGGYHDYENLPKLQAEDLKKRLAKTGPVEIVISKDLAMLEADKLRGFDMLIMSVCGQEEVSPSQRTGLMDAVRNGMPLVALHCTFAAYRTFTEFHPMLGAFVLTHAKYGPMCVRVTDPDSPITRGLPATFEIPDEPYFVEPRDPDVHVLLRTCKTYEGRTGPETHAWTKTFGKGRIFAMALGHDGKAQLDPNVQLLLAQGTEWALGRLK